ncbi:hypothetical protein EVAR_100997_1 [Eumeta japonica]|uniref:Uncharacterized protein n=1 Tax=Eumeta variegata TaxID=151549 RepID=A0A4C1SJU4_EUMVA|nr:hypothetical protein EVAR_100997_1 [Eumeta japonica]
MVGQTAPARHIIKQHRARDELEFYPALRRYDIPALQFAPARQTLQPCLTLGDDRKDTSGVDTHIVKNNDRPKGGAEVDREDRAERRRERPRAYDGPSLFLTAP